MGNEKKNKIEFIGDFCFQYPSDEDTSGAGSNNQEVVKELMSRHYQFYGQFQQERKFVKRDSILWCNMGTKLAKFDMLEDHGVTDAAGAPVGHCKDCKINENIYTFGGCRQSAAENLPSRKTAIVGQTSNRINEMPKCIPLLDESWKSTGFKTLKIYDYQERRYLDALSNGDCLTCLYGGLIRVVEIPTVGGIKKVIVTLEQMSDPRLEWSFRDVTTYNLETSLPDYVDPDHGRRIEQKDIDELNRVMDFYKINLNAERVRHFLAQCGVESEKGYAPVERYTNDPIEDFKKYERPDNLLGNIPGSGDGHRYKGAGALQITGRDAYQKFSDYMGDPKIMSDGALYVGKNYFWESAGFFWSIYKPHTASDKYKLSGDQWSIFESQKGGANLYDLNGKCDGGATVYEFTDIIYGKASAPDEESHLSERTEYYNVYKSLIK